MQRGDAVRSEEMCQRLLFIGSSSVGEGDRGEEMYSFVVSIPDGTRLVIDRDTR